MNSSVKLDVRAEKVDATLDIPLPELARAVELTNNSPQEKSTADKRAFLKQNDQIIRSYIINHLVPSSSGKQWDVSIDTLQLTSARAPTGVGYDRLVISAKLTPPRAGDTRKFQLGYDAVIEKVHDHAALVSITADWASGIVENDDRQVGVIRFDETKQRATPLHIDLSKGNLITGYLAMVRLGMDHIRSGTDHLMFLLTLLLPAPLLMSATRRRWDGFSGYKSTLHKILFITLAFTVGHSVALIVATIAALHLPQQPIEALIAATIIISAVHVIRPLFPGKETLIAVLFGLIHGAAFSFTLAELQVGRTEMFVSLLGFNVGIEIMQLVIVLLVLPALVIMAQSSYYRYFRTIAAVVALLLACGWLGARLGFINPVGIFADSLQSYINYALIGAFVVSAALLMRSCNAKRPE